MKKLTSHKIREHIDCSAPYGCLGSLWRSCGSGQRLSSIQALLRLDQQTCLAKASIRLKEVKFLCCEQLNETVLIPTSSENTPSEKCPVSSQ